MKKITFFVYEGPLYEVMGEDAVITTFNCMVGMKIDNLDGTPVKTYLNANYFFVGHGHSEEYGFDYCLPSRRDAQDCLVDLIANFNYKSFNKNDWVLESPKKLWMAIPYDTLEVQDDYDFMHFDSKEEEDEWYHTYQSSVNP